MNDEPTSMRVLVIATESTTWLYDRWRRGLDEVQAVPRVIEREAAPELAEPEQAAPPPRKQSYRRERRELPKFLR